jgi:hypothetical protein
MIFVPKSIEEMKFFYLVVIVLYTGLNLVLDGLSKDTPPMTADRLRAKIFVLYDATSLASSALVLASIFDSNLAKLLGEFWVPLMLAGASGLIVGISGLFPRRELATAVSQIGPAA